MLGTACLRTLKNGVKNETSLLIQRKKWKFYRWKKTSLNKQFTGLRCMIGMRT